jgi:hypothetical protein
MKGPIRHMWDQFHRLGPIEHFLIDSAELDPRNTTVLIRQRMDAGDLNFPAVDL